MKKIVPAVLLVAFVVYTLELFAMVYQQGWHAFVASATTPWTLQVTVDLFISWFFAGAWIRSDAKRHGIASKPFLVALPFVGAIAVLAYVVRRNFFSATSRQGALPKSALA